MKSLNELVKEIKSKKVSAVEVCEQHLEKASRQDDFNSFIELNETLVAQAKKIHSQVKAGEDVGRLAGVPIGIKDMICTLEGKTTAGSRALDGYQSPFDATLIERIKQEGGLVLGKCNQDEFAMGSSSEHSFYGPVKNPWDKGAVAGGSSGGSAACVAGGLAPASIGTDTGGSIRQPAHFCGLVGLKPTYGRISRHGVIAYASSLDQAGPLTKTVEDAALLLEVMSGSDAKDSTTSQAKVEPWAQSLDLNLRGYRIGLMKDLEKTSCSKETLLAYEAAKKWLEQSGAKIIEVELPLQEVLVSSYYLISASEASSNLSRYDGVRYGHRSSQNTHDLSEFYSQNRAEGFGLEVKRRILMGTYFLSSGYYNQYFQKACQVRRCILDQTLEVFQNCDVILSPVATTPAFQIGEKVNDPLDMYLNDSLTVRANLCGLPAISIPVMTSEKNLPIGLQILGKHFDEQRVLNVAGLIESQAQFWESHQP